MDLVEAMTGGVEAPGRGTGIGLHVRLIGIVDDLILGPYVQQVWEWRKRASAHDLNIFDGAVWATID